MSDNGLPGFRASPKNNVADARGEAWGGKGKGIRERGRKKRKGGEGEKAKGGENKRMDKNKGKRSKKIKLKTYQLRPWL